MSLGRNNSICGFRDYFLFHFSVFFSQRAVSWLKPMRKPEFRSLCNRLKIDSSKFSAQVSGFIFISQSRRSNHKGQASLKPSVLLSFALLFFVVVCPSCKFVSARRMSGTSRKHASESSRHLTFGLEMEEIRLNPPCKQL